MAEHIDGPLYWEQLGKQGTPIAFVHPNPLDHSCWLYQMDHMSTWFRCIGIDLPGYGRSPTAQPGLTMPDVAQACWEAVDDVTDEPAIIVGESVGSTVVWHMANQQPERTLAVVVSGAGFTAGRKQFAETRTGPNTGFNFLTGIGGFLQVFEYGYSGLRFGTNAIQLDPSLSPQLQGIQLNNLQWQGRAFTVAIGPQSTQLHLASGPAMAVQTPAGSQTASVLSSTAKQASPASKE